MFQKIMVPVDLQHVDMMEKALTCAADIARLYDAGICVVGVTTSAPNEMGHTPKEFEGKLKNFVDSKAELLGRNVSHNVRIAHDPTTDMDDVLLRAVDDVGADAVVMATHSPRLSDVVWPSSGGKVATHTGASVFLVRG